MKSSVPLASMWFLQWLFLPSPINAFTNVQPWRRKISTSKTTARTILGAGDIFESFRNFFSGEGNQDNGKDDEIMDEDAAGTSLIASIPGMHAAFLGRKTHCIPWSNRLMSALFRFYSQSLHVVTVVRSIKPGGLRLFLMFTLLGMQNTPDKNSWRADQPSSDDYVLDMLYRDSSGVITIELMEEEILITRCGSVPSTAYLMHEAVIVQ
jgi:hypothetical protein